MGRAATGETAYDSILMAIRSGEFKPGDRLREEEIGSRLALSRTPIREALRRLESDGIVEHRARQGAVIRRLDHAEVVELYEMRVVLERTAAELAAKHGSAAEFDTLEHLNRQIDKERSNTAKAAATNQDFHRCLYMACRNRFLLESARALNNPLMLLGPTTMGEDRIDTVVKEHAAIIEALRLGDTQAAGQAAQSHLQTSLRARLKGMTVSG
ncbi:MAG: GntR family transcriptional regulator [Pseudomonadota bacterium]